MKDLHLWIYSAAIAGHSRILLVADHTVGGAKGRFSTQFGTPTSKNGLPASTPGFPAWIREPGTWIGIVPVGRPGAYHGPDSEVLGAHGLDRYSQDCATAPPQVIPDREDAFIHGDSITAAQHTLENLIRELLQANHPAGALKSL
jgi:hypothetical protein